MCINRSGLCLALALSVVCSCGFSRAGEQRCVVASVQPLATDAGVAAFEKGGNAVDAAVAAALTLGVVDTPNSGLGGGCFVLIRRPDGTLLAIDGREMAPAAATRDMFVRDGKPDPLLSTEGPLASGVPGALAAYDLTLKKCGRLSLSELLLPAAETAERGFPIDRVYARRLADKASTLAKYAGSREALLKRDGSPYREGEVLRQPDLARTYRRIAQEGPDWFYRGGFAEAVSEWMASHGGIITTADFAAYRAIERKPIVTTYRRWRVAGFPPPSSGGIHVAQMLNILERFDLKKEFDSDPVRGSHIVAEAMKLAFADRAYWLGDSAFADVPLGLVDKEYGRDLAERICPEAASEVRSHGQPSDAATRLFDRHTTHIATADSEGYWVAITATINTGFGSKVIVPGTGVVLNDEMDDFSSQPGVANAFGLIGAENNSVAAGKRPLSSMSPTIVMRDDGTPILTVGAAGGPKIITQVLLTVIRTLDLGYGLADAVGAPRFHHQWSPDTLIVEPSSPKSLVRGLEGYGHTIGKSDGYGITQAVGIDATGRLEGVHDPRVPGKVGYGVRAASE